MNSFCGRTPLLKREQGGAKIFLLALSSFLVGAGLTGYLLHRPKPRTDSAVSKASQIVLSESTHAVLGRLKAPVELRYYSLLDPATAPDSFVAFADRVNEWVIQYERQGNGRLKVKRYEDRSYTNANAALRDGIKPFNAEKGEACFLGIALILQDHRESLPQLAPEWEPALESDITRAIARLLDATRPVSPPAPTSPLQVKAVEELKTLIPDVSAVSLEEGTRIIHEAALNELQASAKETEPRLKEAEQRMDDARNKSESEQEAARKNLEQLKAEPIQKLKEVAARSQARIEALQRWKSAQQ